MEGAEFHLISKSCNTHIAETRHRQTYLFWPQMHVLMHLKYYVKVKGKTCH